MKLRSRITFGTLGLLLISLGLCCALIVSVSKKNMLNSTTSYVQAELQKPKYTKEQIVSWINRFKYGDVDDTEYQKQIIDTFINAIYVFDDKLVFTYNFKDGTEAIPLKAVEDAFGSDLTQVAPRAEILGDARVSAFLVLLYTHTIPTNAFFSVPTKNRYARESALFTASK